MAGRSPNLGALKRRLSVIGERIEKVNTDRDSLYEERLTIWKDLRSAGVTREECAELAGTSVQMVKFALASDRKKNGSAKKSTTRTG